MQRIYLAMATIGSDHQIPIACFWDYKDALDFAKKENDEIQAHCIEIETILCVDDYGYPCTRLEYARTFPNRIFQEGNVIHGWPQ